MAFSAILVAVGVGAATSAIQGEQQRKAQRKGLRMQEQAQNESAAAAGAAQRVAEQEQRRVNQKTPDLTNIMQAQNERALAGASATMLTSPAGAPVRPKLGGSSLLGGTPA